MFELGNYLAKYRNLEPPQASVTRLLVEIVRDECGVTLEEGMVSIRNSTAFLSCHPALRSELRLCAPRVLAELQRRGVRLSKIS